MTEPPDERLRTVLVVTGVCLFAAGILVVLAGGLTGPDTGDETDLRPSTDEPSEPATAPSPKPPETERDTEEASPGSKGAATGDGREDDDDDSPEDESAGHRGGGGPPDDPPGHDGDRGPPDTPPGHQ